MTNSRIQTTPTSKPAESTSMKALAKQVTAIREVLRNPELIIPDSIILEMEIEARSNGDWLADRVADAKAHQAGDRQSGSSPSNWLSKALDLATAEDARKKLWPSRSA